MGSVNNVRKAYAAPVIMMSQNRQSSKDRLQAELDLRTNLHAETLIEELPWGDGGSAPSTVAGAAGAPGAAARGVGYARQRSGATVALNVGRRRGRGSLSGTHPLPRGRTIAR